MLPAPSPYRTISVPYQKNMGEWWRWALVSPDGVAPSRMVNVSASVNLPLPHKVQKFSSGTGSPGWSQKRAVKRLWCVWYCYLLITTVCIYSLSQVNASLFRYASQSHLPTSPNDLSSVTLRVGPASGPKQRPAGKSFAVSSVVSREHAGCLWRHLVYAGS